MIFFVSSCDGIISCFAVNGMELISVEFFTHNLIALLVMHSGHWTQHGWHILQGDHFFAFESHMQRKCSDKMKISN